MSACAFDSFPNGNFSSLFILAGFSKKYFSGKTSLPVKNSYFLTYLDDKAEILAIYLSKLY